MNAIIRNIPNYITIANLCCGILSIILTFNNQLSLAALFIFLGIFMDFFDGFFARLLKIENEFGVLASNWQEGIRQAISKLKL